MKSDLAEEVFVFFLRYNFFVRGDPITNIFVSHTDISHLADHIFNFLT